MILEIAEPLQHEYERWFAEIGEDDPYAGQYTIGIHDVLKAHFLIADFFHEIGKGLGGVGPRDLNLLHSALHRQFSGYEGVSKWKDEFEICATLLYGLIMDHPFIDANKRTAFLTSLYHLDKFGRLPSVTQDEFEDFTVKIANRDIQRFRQYKELRKQTSDPEVEYIADFLRRHTRKKDSRHYQINYKELKKVLIRFGYDLANPHGNFIDVVRYEKVRKHIFGSRQEVRTVWVCQIGFPNWNAEVGRGAIRTIRQATRLTARDGVDSEVFFHGADPMEALIATYQEPLKRLANR